VQLSGKRKDFSLRRSISVNLWNDKKSFPIDTSPEGKLMYDYLKSVEQEIFEAELVCIKNRNDYDINDVMSIYNGEDDLSIGVVELFKYHQEQFQELVKAGQRTLASLNKYNNCLKHLVFFIGEKLNKNDVDIKKLNLDFIIEFDHYLRTKGKCSNNTTVKYLQAFKKIVKIGILKGYIDRDPFMEYKAKLDEVDRDYLTDHELDLLHSTKFTRYALELACDAFLLSCYTGLAYADLKKLKSSNVVKEHGELWIKTHRTKSKVKAEIMLLPKALHIIQKYKNNPVCVRQGLIIPMVSNQKLNHHLKDIAKECGIHKHLIYHMARHTFATTVTLAKGVSIEVVSKMLGHKNVKQTQHYAKLVNTRIQDEMMGLKNLYA
jgi:site-specific recombinase XerD